MMLKTLRRTRARGPLALPTLLVVAATLSSCGDATQAPVATLLQIVEGDGQTAPVNTSVTTAPAIKLLDDANKPMAGQSVTFAVVTGGGSVTGATVTTDAQGVARVGGWTLGTATGPNTLRASSGSVPSVHFSATGTAGPAASVRRQAGDGQTAAVAQSVATRPSVVVTDAFGNPVSGLRVTFAPAQGSGSVTGGTPNTDANGMATVGAWNLGVVAGTQTLRATVANVPAVEFTATAEPGPPAKVDILVGNNQSGEVGQALALRPKVRVADTWGNGLGGHAVTYAVASGGGNVAGAQVTSAADGGAEAGSWTLGTTAGTNTVTASVPGLGPATFTATGTAGAVASISVNAGNNQTATVGTEVAIRPSVLVTDQYGNPKSGMPVLFSVGSGGGTVSGANQTTDFAGVARVGGWVLGPAAGANTLMATVAGVPALTFNATAQGTGGGGGGGGGSYSITIRYITPGTAAQQAAVAAAVARWEAIITGDLPDATLNDSPTDPCGLPGLQETVDDILIFVDFAAIDGPGKVLGQAGPCYYRGSGQPINGILRLDAADLDVMASNGTLADVIAHEIGHVLGIGGMWNVGPYSFVTGRGGPDPYFTGVNAVSAFDAVGGTTYGGNKVPVENTGGQGTQDSHWRESVMRSELMTGFISSANNPLSSVTIASLRDMGYQVDMSQADAYNLATALRVEGQESLLELVEAPLPFKPVPFVPARVRR